MDIYKNLPEFLSNIKAFLKKDGAKYDMIRSHYWTSALAAEQLKTHLGIPNVVTFHTLGEVKNRAMGVAEEPELRIREEKRVIATADRIIAFTAEERNNLVNLYGSRPEKVHVIPGGVDLNFFYPMDKEKARRELHLEGYSRVLLFAGRIQPIKGLDLLLHALTQLPNGRSMRLVVSGNADKTDEMVRLNSLVSKLGIEKKVEFIGTVEHKKMPLYYNAADICVVPSYHESFGLVAVESLASGTPVVASRVGGLATTVKDGETGYLMDEHSAEAIAMHLCLLMSENEIRESMAKAARPSVTKYDWSNVARMVLRTYAKLPGIKMPLTIIPGNGHEMVVGVDGGKN
jgi:D-inositol-3-phosphate glycosyltransferase